jgi:hypothetical protein
MVLLSVKSAHSVRSGPDGGDPRHAPNNKNFTCHRYRHRGVVNQIERGTNRTKSGVRAKVERPFGEIKRVFGFATPQGLAVPLAGYQHLTATSVVCAVNRISKLKPGTRFLLKTDSLTSSRMVSAWGGADVVLGV